MRKYVSALAVLLISSFAHAAEKPGGYLFVTFRGEATPLTEQIYFMVSENGRSWEALNNEEPVLVSTVGEEGVRDPYIIRSHDGEKFYLIATDLSIHLTHHNWGRSVTAGSQSIVIWESKDLVNWSEPRLCKVAPDDAGCTWAPEAVYDEERGEYMVFWASMTKGEEPGKHRIWAARTKDFRKFSEPFIYIEKPTTVIDTTIIRDKGVYYRFTKDEKNKAITMEYSSDLMDGWQDVPDFSLAQLQGYEGPTCFMSDPTKDEWCLLLDKYSTGDGYQTYETRDLASGSFKAGDRMAFPFHPVRHGTVMPITRDELKRLKARKSWEQRPELAPTSRQIKLNNVIIDYAAGTIELPVVAGTDLTKLDPSFKTPHGVSMAPKGPQDFSTGPVVYQIGDVSFQVSAEENHNCALNGYFADPDIMYSEKTGKFYIYPTSDGFDGWSGHYFKTFSSPDLVHWTDEGVILDLQKDVDWAESRAWAPCIIEKKIGDEYRYYYYFCAEAKIGVARANSPTGPFRDLGKPLIDSLPKGVNGGQQIDPDVFHDPQSGKDYLYWGNGYMAVAELRQNMAELKESTIQIMTPDHTFREGIHVFYRDGVYYFLWSEDDTRSPNYRVRYAMSESPTGPLTIPENNIVIEKRPEEGIYCTGHNSTIQVPGKDEWYIVYHRFAYPDGIFMINGSGGFHREVCIDKMAFDESGHIIPVTPTHEGIDPVVVEQ
ncbi:MAG: family 43 glycosylhydrolase [Pontiellaceae bacterium]|nr:family 43 glycosylhydrolase [Pontiellaceae bacterium]MBN2784850.1 family 43 glycosylhydrolase [Pontiellaceae bacterium]